MFLDGLLRMLNEVLQVADVPFGGEVQYFQLGCIFRVILKQKDEVVGLELVDFELFGCYLHQLIQLFLEFLL